jgi:hypothetical protein
MVLDVGSIYKLLLRRFYGSFKKITYLMAGEVINEKMKKWVNEEFSHFLFFGKMKKNEEMRKKLKLIKMKI